MKHILVVDDQETVVNSYKKVFGHEGFSLDVADTLQQVLAKTSTRKPDIVLLDIDLKGDGKDHSGEEVLEALRKRWSQAELPVIVISGIGDASLLIKLMNEKGADDYIVQPIDDYQGLLNMVNQYIGRRNCSEATEELWEEKIVGKSKLIMNLTKSILRAAQNDCDTLILGETGTGKNLVAKTYHKLSQRCHNPFYMIHCPAIPKELAESEFFGHEGKSFTGASAEWRKGRIEAADGGVVFLNEIGDLALPHQAVILEFLETHEISPIGTARKKKLDVVVLTATNKDLKKLVEKGEFRKDLYYRLYGSVIFNPPLRDYLEDMPFLVDHFIRKSNQTSKKKIRGAEEEVLRKFSEFQWDGNVRQLEKCIMDFGVPKCQGDKIVWNDVKDFFKDKMVLGAPKEVFNLEMKYEQFTEYCDTQYKELARKYYGYHLSKNKGNITQTANALGMTRQYLNELMNKIGLDKK